MDHSMTQDWVYSHKLESDFRNPASKKYLYTNHVNGEDPLEALKRRNNQLDEYLHTIDDNDDFTEFSEDQDQYNLFKKNSEKKGGFLRRTGTGGDRGGTKMFREERLSPLVQEKKESKGWLASLMDKLGCSSCAK